MSKFNEMYSKNVSDKIEKKNGLSYLSWAFAWAEVKKIDENADYQIHEDANGNAFFASSIGIDCKVSVTINNKTHTMRLPVMDGANKSMKLEAYEYTTKYGKKTVEAATSFDVNKTIMRCLVKAIAMHGLGLYIYAGEDLPEDTNNDIVPEQKVKVTLEAPPVQAKAAPAKTVVTVTNAVVDAASVDVTAKPKPEQIAPTAKKGFGGIRAKMTKPTETKGDLY